jgi:hypothetical protein
MNLDIENEATTGSTMNLEAGAKLPVDTENVTIEDDIESAEEDNKTGAYTARQRWRAKQSKMRSQAQVDEPRIVLQPGVAQSRLGTFQLLILVLITMNV